VLLSAAQREYLILIRKELSAEVEAEEEWLQFMVGLLNCISRSW
jgi:hypothetical protein